MHLDREDLGRDDLTASGPTIKDKKTILIEDSDSNEKNQVAPLDVFIGVGDVPSLEPTDIRTTVEVSGIDY